MSKKLKEKKQIDFAPGEDTFGLKVYREVYELPDGTEEIYWKDELPDVAQVLGMTRHGQVIAIKEWNARMNLDYVHLVGETVEENENPHEAAERGLLEETGYQATSITLLSTIARDSRTYGKIYCYLAERCVKKQQGEKEIETVLLDPDVFWLSFMKYFMAQSEGVRGGGNSLKTVTLAFQYLGLLITVKGA